MTTNMTTKAKAKKQSRQTNHHEAYEDEEQLGADG
jgi:hypothetical protein